MNNKDQMRATNDGPRFDLEDRLLDYAAMVIRFTESMLKSDAGRHVSGQLLRSGTAALEQQGETTTAESTKDFIHKMKVALKELRESMRWIKLAVRVPLIKDATATKKILAETDELIRIFVSSVRTARSNALRANR